MDNDASQCPVDSPDNQSWQSPTDKYIALNLTFAAMSLHSLGVRVALCESNARSEARRCEWEDQAQRFPSVSRLSVGALKEGWPSGFLEMREKECADIAARCRHDFALEIEANKRSEPNPLPEDRGHNGPDTSSDAALLESAVAEPVAKYAPEDSTDTGTTVAEMLAFLESAPDPIDDMLQDANRLTSSFNDSQTHWERCADHLVKALEKAQKLDHLQVTSEDSQDDITARKYASTLASLRRTVADKEQQLGGDAASGPASASQFNDETTIADVHETVGKATGELRESCAESSANAFSVLTSDATLADKANAMKTAAALLQSYSKEYFATLKDGIAHIHRIRDAARALETGSEAVKEETSPTDLVRLGDHFDRA